MNVRWLKSFVVLGALCGAPSILLRAQQSSKFSADAIGLRRNVGCEWARRSDALYVEHQAAWGRSFAQQIESQVKLVTDPVVIEYVNRIGQNIVRNSDSPVPFTIKVIDSDVVNAMALPGGFLYVTSGLLIVADGEAEVAGVMAHQIAHVAACSVGRTMDLRVQLPSIPIILPLGGIDDMEYVPEVLEFSRGLEREADYLGIWYMYRAGYDPSALISVFEKIYAMQNVPWRPGAVAKSFKTHPQSADRIERSEEEIRGLLPVGQQYVVTNSDFDEVKARLEAIENKAKVVNHKGPDNPSLRRTSKPVG